ncbi:MAG: DUF4234 domain-containing protein [Actinobacteria bacterium]|uniref:Unannotated protein n=1 Tax=freshwater metagenome TaxID=449393 RepID=A0A6J6A0P1_9ZZZZ|nr:DUF4234 domain-containing protein [Actinomycetota bacterium]
MAEVVTISGTASTAKIRNPLAVVGLTLITLGIYYLYWYYSINRELRDLGRSRDTDECGTSPGTSLLAITLGVLILVPPFVSHFKVWKRMNAASRLTGSGDGFDAGLGLLIWVFLSPIAVYLFQMNLNKVWKAEQGSVGGAATAAIEEAPPAQSAPEPAADAGSEQPS